jgi:CRP-like cAMP-binding protein
MAAPPRPVSHSLVKALRGVPLFATLDDRTIVQVVGESANLVWREGSAVFRAGNDAEALYIVLSGRVRIHGRDGEHVGDVGPGEFFGERSLLHEGIHSRDAEAVETCELMVLPKECFERLVHEESSVGEAVREAVQRRLGAGG